jgi:dethiobiotin synthetase
MYKGIFVTATDTEAGKTYISCRIAHELVKMGVQTGVMKPFASGSRSDAYKLIKASGAKDKIEKINPLYFKFPLAPYASAVLEKKKVGLSLVWKSYKELSKKYEFMVVEGIGGLLVPIKNDYNVLDLIKGFKLPVVVVARPGLGTVNHTLLTVQKLKQNKIKVLGIILSGKRKNSISERTNPQVIKTLTGLPVLEVPYGKTINLRKNKWLIGL